MQSRTMTVGAVAFTLLALEILFARLYPVFLGSVSAFVAIPVAMFGLGIGATCMHLLRRDLDERWLERLVPGLWLVTLSCLLAGFFLFNHVFNLTHFKLQNPVTEATRIATLLLVFTPIFGLGGVVLSVCFRAGAAHVGRLYAFDLLGSAFACFAAPLLLHWFDLPVVFVFVLGALGLAGVGNLREERRPRAWIVLVPALVVLLGLAMSQRVFTERPDPDALGVRYARGRTVEEVSHRWNEVSRVALMKWTDAKGRSETRVVHDDGISNVRLRTWRPRRLKRKSTYDGTHGVPFLLGLKPKNALVIFAGVGRDMMLLYEHMQGELEVTGVELNDRVPWLAADGWNLQEFWDLDDIDLRIDEGRAFLERAKETYDLIYVASNGAQYATRTGHTRKFLETREAMEAYLDLLAPGGMIVFAVQPSEHKIQHFKSIFEERGMGPLEDAVAIVGPADRVWGTWTLIVRPDGIDRDARDRLLEKWDRQEGRGRVLFDPDVRTHKRISSWVTDPIDSGRALPTDDRPYERRVDLSSFTLRPDPEKMAKNLNYRLSWVKGFTVVFFTALAGLLVAILQLVPRGGSRLPVPLTLWFLASGVAYMFAQIGLMAKLELFMGKPLYSISVVLAAFLLANGLGSALVERREAVGRPLPGWFSPVAAAVFVPATLFLVENVLPVAMTWPLLVRAVLALLAVGPLAAVLGTFYPLGATRTVERGLDQLVPATFGLATLSSAVGSTVAMVLIINHGFRTVVLWSVPVYLVLAVLGALFLRSHR